MHDLIVIARKFRLVCLHRRAVYQQVVNAVDGDFNVQREIADIGQHLFTICLGAMFERTMGKITAIPVPAGHLFLRAGLRQRLQHHVLMVTEQKGDVGFLHGVAQDVKTTRRTVDYITEDIQMIL